MKTKEKLKSFYKEYKDNISVTPQSTSFARLAELYNSISTKFVNKREKYYWINIIENEIKSYENIDKIILLLEEKEKRVRKILNYGNCFDEDEILLLLTFLIEIEQIQNLLKDFDLLSNYKPIKNLFEDFKYSMEDTLNIKKYEISRKLLLKNSVLPITSNLI